MNTRACLESICDEPSVDLSADSRRSARLGEYAKVVSVRRAVQHAARDEFAILVEEKGVDPCLIIDDYWPPGVSPKTREDFLQALQYGVDLSHAITAYWPPLNADP